jgi:hypothetical protein
VNIFTINNPAASASGSGNGKGESSIGAHVLDKLKRWSQNATRKPVRRKTMEERLRSAFDPARRKQRKDVRRWRRWHEVFRVLNEIEQRLAEVVSLLVQAAASMKQFADTHSRLSDCARLSAFLRDAALYFQSESGIPKRLESHLDNLERVADEFRSISVQAVEQSEANGASELWRSCEDLQVDIAVLLESTQMNAQHALAEYKKMHCRLELLVTEYEPICRLELEAARPAFLPLLTDDSAKQVGTASQELQELVRELDHRAKQVSACSQELRGNTLQLAASAQTQPSD